MEELKILLLTDIHYIENAKHTCNISSRKTAFALEFIQKVLELTRVINLDVIVLLGDLVDNGEAEDAEKDLLMIKKEIAKTNIKVIAIPGNHDCDINKFYDIFNDYQGLHKIKNYQLISFADKYDKNDRCIREINKMEEIFKGIDKNLPTIIFQHNPIYPPIDSKYPYNIINANEVINCYANNNVNLSISGHYHQGISIKSIKGVDYLTCPALCEEPFKFNILTLNGQNYNLDEYKLKVPEKNFINDFHIHTDFAYCSSSKMKPEKIIKRADMYGLKKIAFTEHAAQLYVSSEDYWSGNFINQPELIYKNSTEKYNRMDEYKKTVMSYKSDKVLAGLEVEVNKKGELVLLEEDKTDWDILLGAVHKLPQKYSENNKSGFMWANEMLIKNGIDILAHPFRFFYRNNIETPKELYKPLAKLLAKYRVAVEINFHTNLPDLEFFKLCVNEGVKISLASDAHQLYEIGLNQNYFEFLQQICEPNKWSEILFSP